MAGDLLTNGWNPLSPPPPPQALGLRMGLSQSTLHFSLIYNGFFLKLRPFGFFLSAFQNNNIGRSDRYFDLLLTPFKKSQHYMKQSTLSSCADNSLVGKFVEGHSELKFNLKLFAILFSIHIVVSVERFVLSIENKTTNQSSFSMILSNYYKL